MADPAVVVLDEAGRYAVSLLAGHEGGANRLAYRVANVVGATPVVTTATEALKPLVLGIGCRKDVAVERIEAAVRNALGERRLVEVREVATVDIKADEPGLIAFCERHALPQIDIHELAVFVEVIVLLQVRTGVRPEPRPTENRGPWPSAPRRAEALARIMARHSGPLGDELVAPWARRAPRSDRSPPRRPRSCGGSWPDCE